MVCANVNWGTDAEAMTAYTARYSPATGVVFVELHDPRCATWGAWLKLENVEVLAPGLREGGY